jgi:hypothetical protein
LCGANSEVKNVLSALNADQHLQQSNMFESRQQALEAALIAIN